MTNYPQITQMINWASYWLLRSHLGNLRIVMNWNISNQIDVKELMTFGCNRLHSRNPASFTFEIIGE